MADNYLHNQPDFPDLLQILGERMKIDPYLVEKDYWIMQVLYGLKKKGYVFELKGGTSLSKGYKIIDRFSEDIDIHIKPPAALAVNENPKNTSDKTIAGRKKFYDWLKDDITIDGIISAERDTAFDDEQHYRSGGIRLQYESVTQKISGIKEGILLEAGFTQVTPNNNLLISSWAYDEAAATPGITIIDNRAINIACYHPGYTLVEKLQTIATKFRHEQGTGEIKQNYLRQYYDVYSLLGNEEVQAFIGTADYTAHKASWFPKADFEIPVTENEAYLLSDPALRASHAARYISSAALYYKGQPDFEIILDRIKEYLPQL